MNNITKLPDGSAFFTATTMSKDEAMALPLKERPLCFRISSEMYHAVFESIGEASMCWNPAPSSEVFASEKASDVAVRLCFKIADEVERAKLDGFKYGMTEAADIVLEYAKTMRGAHVNTNVSTAVIKNLLLTSRANKTL